MRMDSFRTSKFKLHFWIVKLPQNDSNKIDISHRPPYGQVLIKRRKYVHGSTWSFLYVRECLHYPISYCFTKRGEVTWIRSSLARHLSNIIFLNVLRLFNLHFQHFFKLSPYYNRHVVTQKFIDQKMKQNEQRDVYRRPCIFLSRNWFCCRDCVVDVRKIHAIVT